MDIFPHSDPVLVVSTKLTHPPRHIQICVLPHIHTSHHTTRLIESHCVMLLQAELTNGTGIVTDTQPEVVIRSLAVEGCACGKDCKCGSKCVGNLYCPCVCLGCELATCTYVVIVCVGCGLLCVCVCVCVCVCTHFLLSALITSTMV